MSKQPEPKPRVTITHNRWLSMDGEPQLQDLETLTREARRLGYADDARVGIIPAAFGNIFPPRQRITINHETEIKP